MADTLHGLDLSLWPGSPDSVLLSAYAMANKERVQIPLRCWVDERPEEERPRVLTVITLCSSKDTERHTAGFERRIPIG